MTGQRPPAADGCCLTPGYHAACPTKVSQLAEGPGWIQGLLLCPSTSHSPFPLLWGLICGDCIWGCDVHPGESWTKQFMGAPHSPCRKKSGSKWSSERHIGLPKVTQHCRDRTDNGWPSLGNPRCVPTAPTCTSSPCPGSQAVWQISAAFQIKPASKWDIKHLLFPHKSWGQPDQPQGFESSASFPNK